MVRGQEAVVSKHGLGRIEDFDSETVTVRTYVDGVSRCYDKDNVRLVEINYAEDKWK